MSNGSLRRRSRVAVRRAARRGLAVVELLIALSISGMVLVAVAMCVDASFRAYSINQEQSDLMQRSRLAMHRVLTTNRTTDAHEPSDATAKAGFMMGSVVVDSGIKMLDASESEITFKLNPTNGLLTATDGTGAEYVVLRGVEKFEIKFEPMRSQDAVRRGELGYDRLRRATVLLTVRTAGNSVDIDESVASQSVTLSSSAVPRRNVW